MPRPVRARSLRGPAEETVAWEVEPVRTAWSRHARSSVRWTLTGLLVGTFVAVIVLVLDHQDRELLKNGTRAEATVVGGDEGSTRGSGPSVDVELIADGRTVRATISGEDPEDRPRGSHLTVYYDADHPDRVRSKDHGSNEQALFWIVVIPAAIGVPAIVVGGWGLLAALRWRRWLRRWPPVRATVAERTRSRFFRSDLWLLHVVTMSPAADVVAREVGATRWMEVSDLWSGDTDFEGPAFVSAGRHRRVVVVDPDVDKPVEVRLPRSHRQARRWRRSYDRVVVKAD